MEWLGDLSDGSFRSGADGSSADGSVVVGQGTAGSFSIGEAFYVGSLVLVALGMATRRRAA